MQDVTVFRPYPFQPGEKIRIEGGRRRGDWQVVAVDDKNVTLRCPVSGREFSWAQFCYLVGVESRHWPER
jgi:hypothetical protein